jgi:RHS repeat-associated protein
MAAGRLAERYKPVQWLIASVLLLLASGVSAQVCPEDLQLTTFQSPVSARKITVVRGGTFIIGANQTFEAQSCQIAPVAPTVPVATMLCGATLLSPLQVVEGTTHFLQSTPAGVATDGPLPLTVSQSGTYYVRARNNQTLQWSQPTTISVTTANLPVAPGAPVLSNVTASSALLTAPTAPSGETYYFQTSADGTSTDHPSQWSVTQNGTYYLRSGRYYSASTRLVTRYSFEESDGSPILDGAGSANATTTGEIYHNSSGRYGQSLFAGGSGSLQARVENTGFQWNPTSFSVSFWIKPNAAQNSNPIGSASGFSIASTPTGVISISTTASSTVSTGAGVVSIGQWQHYALTYQATSASQGTVRLYKNGQLLLTQTGMGKPAAFSGLYLGKPSTSADDPIPSLNAELDEFRLYEGALSALEVNTLYATNASTGLSDICWSAPSAPVTVTLTEPVLSDLNFVREHSVLVSGLLTRDDVNYQSADNVAEQTTYMDGLGRPVQQVSRQGSPTKKDLITPIAYDAFGREVKKYLPFPDPTQESGLYKPTAIADQQSRYNQLKPAEGPAFSETVFENSPLNRPIEQGAPGTPWQIGSGHTIQMIQRSNSQNGDAILSWDYNFSSRLAISHPGHYYGDGELLVSETTDEHGAKTIEFKDKQGQVVAKKVQDSKTNPNSFATTYYVYDDMGLLRFVLPPMAVDNLGSTSGGALDQPSQQYRIGYQQPGSAQTTYAPGAFTRRWCFAYRYDERKRMIEKSVPGADPVYMVHNLRDELILTQDGAQRTRNEWSFTKYDALGRVVLTGLYVHNSAASPEQMQSFVQSWLLADPSRKLYEDWSSDNYILQHGYTANAFPPLSAIIQCDGSVSGSFNPPPAGTTPTWIAAGFTPALGSQTILATPYTVVNGTSTAGTPLAIPFQVINGRANQAPSVSAGADQNFQLPTNSTVLRATAYDPDGSVASYQWSKISGGTVTLSGANTASLTLTGLLDTTYVFRVTVTDNGGAQASDEVTVRVTAPPILPVFYRAINLNGPTVQVDGKSFEGSATAANVSTTGSADSSPSVPLSPVTDAARTQMITTSLSSNPTVSVGSVPSGYYDVYLYQWENDYPDGLAFYIEGTQVLDYHAIATAGKWFRHGPFRTQVTDGTLSIAAQGYGGLSGVEIYSIPTSGFVGNIPPTVSLRNPTENITVAVNEYFPLRTYATDMDGSVSTIEYYVNGTKLDELTDAPYEKWHAFDSVGVYHLIAKAVDNQGGTGTSLERIIRVGDQVDVLQVDGLQSFLAFSESSGAVAFDQSGKDNRGRLVGSPAWKSNGRIGSALQLEAGKYIVIDSLKAQPNSFSIGLWLAPTTLSGTMNLVSAGTGSNNGWGTFALEIAANGSLRIGTTTATALAAPAGTVQAGKWQHLLFTFDASWNNATGRLYKNGQLVATQPAMSLSANNWNGIQVGGASSAYTGMIDEVRVYSRPLTEAEVASLASVSNGSQANIAPAITLTAPATAAAGSTVSLSATATDSEGGVAQVEFYANGTLLGTDVTAPYSLSWNPPQGWFELTAKAYDYQGAYSVSTIRMLTVGSVTPTFVRAINLNGLAGTLSGNSWQASAGAANFSFTGESGAFSSSATLSPTVADPYQRDMIRSSIWGYNISMNVSSLSAANYQVYLWVWEDNSPEVYSISIESQTVQNNYNSGSAGSWSRLGPYTVRVDDGTLNVAFSGGAANVSGIEIYRLPDPTILPAASSSVVRMVLVNGNTGAEIGPLVAGDILDLATLPTQNLNIRAVTNPDSVARVDFVLKRIKSDGSEESITSSDATRPAPNAGYYFRNTDSPVLPGGNDSPIATQAGVEVLTVNYYDDYNYDRTGTEDVSYTQVYSDMAVYTNVQGKPTGSKVKVLRQSNATQCNQWLFSSSFYDNKGRVIQTQTQNHLQPIEITAQVLSTQTLAQLLANTKVDIVSTRYDFAGRVLATQTTHRRTSAADLVVKTRPVFDHTGRVTEGYQAINNEAEVQVAKMTYSEIGEVTVKELGKEGAAFLQTVNFEYNIRGWMTKINDATLSQAGDLFGMELAYNATTLQGSQGQFNGNISEQKWMSGYDKVQRRYAYHYDAMNRIVRADYKAENANAILPALASESYAMPLVAYDRNGNISTLQRWGGKSFDASGKALTFGLIDDLRYGYRQGGGNELVNVSDFSQTGPQTGLSPAGDLVDPNTSLFTEEYFYDKSGNMTKDLHKNITVEYNHLNLPRAIRYTNTSNWIENIYSAAGVKLAKIVHTDMNAKRTDYVGGMVYEMDVLQFVPTGEGRALPPQITGKATYTYEYHYKDHLGNLRMAFQKGATNSYSAGMETTDPVVAQREEAQFANVTATRNGEFASLGTKSSKLTPANPMGPLRIIKVRRGDKLSASVRGMYTSASSNNLASGLSVFLQASGGNPAGQTEGGNSWPTLQVGLSSSIIQPNASPELPKAYLRMIFYNNQQVQVAERVAYLASGANSFQYLPISEQVVGQTGYVRIFVANESDVAVWFDELSITHTESPIVQENHYDPWGLNLAGIETAGHPNHKFQYNGKEKQEEFGLNWSDYGARMYDSQLGRWHAVDPLAEKLYSWSPYNYADDDPINIIDPDGQSGEPIIDKKKGTITVHMRMIFYGSQATDKVAEASANETAWMYNAAKGKVKVDGKEYKVKFKVNYMVVSEADAEKMASENTSVINNFVRVEKNNEAEGRSFMAIGDNSGFFNTDDNLGSSTTAAHEVGHGFGLIHTEGDQRGKGQPDIMAARGTAVDAPYTYSPRKGDTKMSRKTVDGKQVTIKENTINPQTRRVTQRNITDMFKGVTYDSNGKGQIGKASNTIYDSKGYKKQ